jgi:hypothetical protein
LGAQRLEVQSKYGNSVCRAGGESVNRNEHPLPMLNDSAATNVVPVAAPDRSRFIRRRQA